MKALLSIDIGSKQIKLVYANISSRQVNVSNCYMLDTPADCMQDGIVTDFDVIAEMIGQEVSKNKWRGSKTSVVITSPDIVVREIKLPKASAKNIRTIVTNEMSSYLGNEEYAVEFFLQNQDKNTLKAHAFAMPSQVIENYKRMISQAYLSPIALDIGANCIRKLNMGMKSAHTDDEIIVCVDIGYNFINFNIFSKTYLLYTRCIKIELESKYKIPMKKPEMTEEPGENTADLDNIYLSYIGDEIQKILQFLASSEYKDKKITVCLYGGGANYFEIDKWIAEYLNIEVMIMDDQKHPGIKGANLKEYANALGAQIRL